MSSIGNNNYQSCINFTSADTNSFKIDPNGQWGDDFPAQNYVVSKGWVKISYNSTTKTITTEQNLAANCAITYHLRGTQTTTAWAEGDLFTPVAGSATNYEICRNFTVGDAKGGPRFKIDPNGAWTDEFPAADVAAAGWTKIIIDGSTKSIVSKVMNLSSNCSGSTSSTASSTTSSAGSSVSSSTSSAADDFRARTTYFMFVDRFANGDTSNDQGLNPKGTLAANAADPQHLKAPLADWKKYWGGDIQGMIDKLDYLQALGITAIWVTPLVDNVNNTGDEGIYHGYQARDFYEVDEHLGNWALVDKLNAEMEKRNMKLVLDIALNHSNNAKAFEFGELLKEGTHITDFLTGKGKWYHDAGTIQDCGAACANDWNDPVAYHNKMLFDLADFNHGVDSNSVADEYLINAALKWMDHGVDAFRIDAIKHIEPNFVNRFTAAVRAKKPDIYVFGEWFDAGVGETGSMQFLSEKRGSDLLDFRLRYILESAISGTNSMKALDAYIASRPGAMSGRETWQPIFLDNHDSERTSVYFQTKSDTTRGPGKGMSKSDSDATQNLGMAMVMTLPGVPVVYYGTEQNTAVFNVNFQPGADPFNREMMPSFNQTTPAFKLISALATLRKDSTAIQSGSYKQLWINDDILVFQRQQGNDCAVIAVNRGPAMSIDVQGLCLANAAYTNKVGTEVVNVASGTGKFNLPQRGTIVLH